MACCGISCVELHDSATMVWNLILLSCMVGEKKKRSLGTDIS
jgi:hypothetical protein